MIKVDIQSITLKDIEKKLDNLSNKSPEVLKNSINDTAKQARKQISLQAQKTYVMKTGRFNKAMKIKNASKTKLEAIIGATGSVTELKDFKVSPAKVAPKDNKPDVVKGKGLKQSSMKKLQKGDLKAFVARFANGHVSVVQRRTDKRFPLKKFLSPSLPKMLGNEEKVYGIVQPDIYKNLQDNIEKHISKVLEGK